MSSTDERKIPKIVLKINRNESISSSQETGNSIFSSKAAEIAKEFYKFENNGMMISCSQLLKRVNQNSYKSIENILELMGRMNDIEKKKTLFQVLSRLKDVYMKVQLILEWTKVSNEHLALQAIKNTANSTKDNLNRLIGGLYQNSEILLTRKHFEADYFAYKDLILSPDRLPSYFPPSIDSLAPKASSKLPEKDISCWLSSLDSLLRCEISKNFVNISKRDFKIISVAEGKAKVLFLNLFEFEFTIVPIIINEESLGTTTTATSASTRLSPAWFILGVSVDSMKELFKNSLTGIFQFRHNNVLTSNLEYFKTLLSDCEKYINLFYYEKLYSQFYFLSNSLGKSICSFHKDDGSWHKDVGSCFKVSPWFMDDGVKISFSNDTKFIVYPNTLNDLFKPSISFDEDDSKVVFERLFKEFYIQKLENFFQELIVKNVIVGFEYKSKFSFELFLFEDLLMKITINPMKKKFKFDIISTVNIYIFKSENFEDSLFDTERFTEAITEIKKNFIIEILKEPCGSLTLVRGSPHEICLQLKPTNSCFTIDLSLGIVKFMRYILRFNNGFLDIKFEEYGITRDFSTFTTKEDLFTLLHDQEELLKTLTMKGAFEKIIKESGIEGEFVGENLFKIYSFGLPNCVRKVSLIWEGQDNDSKRIHGLIELQEQEQEQEQEQQEQEQEDSKEICVFLENFDSLLLSLKNYIKLFTIWEELNLLKTKCELVSINPISITINDNVTFSVSDSNGSLIIKTSNDRLKNLKEFLESDSFTIYDFLDLINAEDDFIEKCESEKSPDITWLSDSFM